MTNRISCKLSLLAAASVFGLVLAAGPAAAQDYYGSADDDYAPPAGRAVPPPAPAYDQSVPAEEVIVTAPRPRFEERRGELGGRVEDVSLSQDVRYDDLDLTTPEGAHELRDRIRYTAREECRRLDQMYPIASDDSPPCYRTAVDDGMQQADEAIGRARSYAERE